MSDEMLVELERRMRCLLAEEGYGDVRIEVIPGLGAHGRPSIGVCADVPAEIIWRAGHLLRPGACWSCFISGNDERNYRCSEGECRAGSDTPRVPPRSAS